MIAVDDQGADGSRMPTPRELEVAETQGDSFYKAVAKVNFA
jgi:NAD(P)H dehydrogenase (quinone)